MRAQSHSGFTLIELSIVLVIIGLLVGGVLVGRSLIEAAELRSLLSQVENYKTAVNTFRLKYNCKPGDCAAVGQFFPIDAACTVYGATSASFRPYIATANGQTCVGDGNGIVFGPSSAFGEVYLFWQHLSLASLVEGNFTGATAKPGTDYLSLTYYAAGINTPSAKIKSAMFTVMYPLSEMALWTGFGGNHYFWLGRPGNNLTAYWEYWPMPVLTTLQAQTIDAKTDDGLPRTGGIQSDQWNTSCYTGSPAAYNISLTTPNCSMLFVTNF
jgi:prepilin-type N-terminal cleavage/methylation domain-containing protein